LVKKIGQVAHAQKKNDYLGVEFIEKIISQQIIKGQPNLGL